jgi:hypothetical protein
MQLPDLPLRQAPSFREGLPSAVRALDAGFHRGECKVT